MSLGLKEKGTAALRYQGAGKWDMSALEAGRGRGHTLSPAARSLASEGSAKPQRPPTAPQRSLLSLFVHSPHVQPERLLLKLP